MNSNQRKLTARAISILLFVSLLAGFAPGFVSRADAAPDDKSILSFSFASPPASGVISGNNITVMVPYGTDVTALVPTITHNGASISPNSGVAQNFTNPVTYTVTAADATTQNYLVSVIIPITVTANAGQSKVFGSADPVFTYTPSNPIAFTGALSRVAGEAVGSYAIQQGTLAAVGSNDSIIFVSNPFSITPKPVTVTPTVGQNKVFGSTDPAFTYTSSDPAATFIGALSRAAGENVGTYAFALGTLSAGSNYTLSLAPENFSITPKPVTVTPAAGQSKVFGSADPAFTYTSSDPAATFTGTLSRAVGEDVGTYAFNLGTLSAGGNYTLSLAAANFSVTPKPVIVTPAAGQNKVFGSSDPAFTYTSSDPAATFTGALSRLTGENAGTYGFTLGTLSAGSNYSLGIAAENFTITPKPVAVTPTAGQSKVFGSPDPVYTYTSSEPAATFTGSLSHVAGENVGIYAFTLGTLSAGGNYSLTVTAENFVITPKPITVTPTAGQSKVFGSADPAFAYTSSDPAATFTGALSRATGENVGTYAFALGTLSAGGNYTVSLTAANFSITPKPLIVTPTAGQSKVSGSPDPVFAYTSSDPAATFTGALSRVAGEAVGTYAYTLGTLNAGSNYSLGIAAETFAILPGPSKYITAFSFTTPSAVATISGTDISVTVPYGTDVTTLVANFTTTGASVKVGATTQVSGTTPNNFTSPVTYTVTALDASTKDYTVTVTIAPSPAKDITAFSFTTPAAVGTISGTNISVTVPYGTDVAALVATFTTTGASVKVGSTTQVSGTTPNNFTNPVTYTVTALDASTKDYTVMVTAAPNPAKDITAFSFTAPASVGTISGTNISVTVPYGTNITALVATFTTSGASVKVGATTQVSGATPNNFTSPVTYTVTALDASTKDYTVTVTAAPSPAKDITAFSFTTPSAVATISGTDISVTVPYGTNVTALVATFTTTGASVKVGATTQVSGTTPNNFTSPVTYTVTAADSSTKDYTVTVTFSANPAKDITAFSFTTPAAVGTISGTNISVALPYGTNVTALVATFTTTGASVKVGDITQVSGTTPNNFTSPVVYTVTAADNSTKSYTVTVKFLAPKDITDFRFVAQTAVGLIDGSNITVAIPMGADVRALVASFTTTGTSVKVGGITQVNGTTPNNFTSPVTYTVTALDGSTKNYTVRVTVAPSSEKDITEFHFVTPDAVGTISGTNIAVTVPYGTDVRALTAHFTTSGSSVKIGFTSQVSGSTVNDFTSPVTYTVTAADNSTKTYAVTVTVAPDARNKDITSFSFPDLAVKGSISGTKISVTIPYGTDASALVAEFTTTGMSVNVGNTKQVSGITTNNFSNASRKPVVYSVVAANGSTKDYSVTVNVAAKSSKDITSFGFVNPAVTGAIKGTNIEVKVPYGTDLSRLVATFTTTGVSVKVGKVEQESGVTYNGFTKPLTYVVVAGDKSERYYKVTVLIVSKDITSFVFRDPAAVGVISGNNISVTVPHGTNVRKLVATFKTTGMYVLVNSKKQDSGKTPNDFSKPVTYIVTASDKSTRPYTVTVTIARKIVTEKFRSNGLRDGWVLESGEYSNVGGSSVTNAVLRLGDDFADRQYRALLHFPTYYLPDNAVVTRALLMIQRKGVVGTDPFTTHGPVSVDISKGSFVNINLNASEPLPFNLFEASADIYSAGIIQNNPDAGWYWSLLDDKALSYVNLLGITQVRLQFQLDDNDDLEHDYAEFYSGDKVPLNNRPYLLVDYYVP